MVFQDFPQEFSLPEVRHVEMSQPKRTRELSQLVETKGLGEDVGVLLIRQIILKFDFTKEDTLEDKVDVGKVVAVDRRWIRHLHMQILK